MTPLRHEQRVCQLDVRVQNSTSRKGASHICCLGIIVKGVVPSYGFGFFSVDLDVERAGT